VLLVGRLRLKVIEEHEFGDLPGGVDDVALFGVGEDTDVQFLYHGDAGEGFETGYELVAVFGGGGVPEPEEDMVDDGWTCRAGGYALGFGCAERGGRGQDGSGGCGAFSDKGSSVGAFHLLKGNSLFREKKLSFC
jgi:hypothetical protein